MCTLRRSFFTLRGYLTPLRRAVMTNSMVFVLVAGSIMMGHFLAVTKIPMVTAEWVASLSLIRYLILALVLLVYQVGGSFIDDFAFMMLATPIFYPVIMKLGFDPIWFGIIIMVNLMVGGIIPPLLPCRFLL